MHVQKDINLQPYNTFGIEATAECFLEINQLSDLMSLPIRQGNELLVIGGGSNLLFTRNPSEMIVKMNLKGIQSVGETDESIFIKAAAGENWHEFVLSTLDKNWFGLENLSLIPGSVGASPIQNIGAYGVEIKDVFFELEAFHIATKEIHTFSAEDCHFGYRESVFKRKLKNQYILVSVTFKLSKHQQLSISYGAITKELEAEGIDRPTPKDVSKVVCKIRQSKLPDITEIGCAGSFFKNPIITIQHFQSLQLAHPEIPSYSVSDTEVKVPAGWLIEHTGWKGKTFGNYGVYPKQALVLVNYGGATGQEIFRLSEEIIQSVKEKFQITIEREVNII